jgi:hypothetical protein
MHCNLIPGLCCWIGLTHFFAKVDVYAVKHIRDYKNANAGLRKTRLMQVRPFNKMLEM